MMEATSTARHYDDSRLLRELLAIPMHCGPQTRPGEALERCALQVSRVLGVPAVIHWAADGSLPERKRPRTELVKVSCMGRPWALLELQGELPDTEALRFGLEHLSFDLTQAVTAAAAAQVRQAIATLRKAMVADESEEVLLSVAIDQLGAEAGALLVQPAADRASYALAGSWKRDPALDEAFADLIARGMAETEPRLHEDGLLTVPLNRRKPVRGLFIIRFASAARARQVPPTMPEELANVAQPFIAGRWRDLVLTELLELNRAGEKTASGQLYASILRTAVRLVPGADSGSLLTRAERHAPFSYEAAEGFNLSLLRKRRLSEKAVRAWYGTENDAWQQGLPRILRRDHLDIVRHGQSTTAGLPSAATAYESIASTLCLPVWRDGHVMAVLNLDNGSDPDAFADDSLSLATIFGPPLASLLHRHRTGELLRRAALTDELTGLPNRRAFEQALEGEHARSIRDGLPFSLLMLDMMDFKEVNDGYGHEAGDRILSAVGSALRDNVRQGDFAARLGGDEFVAILHASGTAEAAVVAERIRQAVRGLRRDDGSGSETLEINIGAATFGPDGTDLQELRRLADRRMYEEKRRRQQRTA